MKQEFHTIDQFSVRFLSRTETDASQKKKKKLKRMGYMGIG